MIIPAEIIQTIENNNKFIITSHAAPDPDAVGASLILFFLLKKLNKEAKVVLHDLPPKNLGFFPYLDEIVHADSLDKQTYDVLCVVDCGSLARTCLFKTEEEYPEKVLNIDHHISNEKFGSANWLVADASACTMLLFYLYEHFKVSMPVNVGEILYASLLTETGCFQYSNTNADCLQVACKMVDLGVRPNKVVDHLFNSHAIGRLRLTGEILKNITVSDNGKIGWLLVTKADLGATSTSFEDTDGLVNYALSIAGVEVGVLLKEMEINSAYKISLRSKGKINVSDVAANFGGGGHKQAAGCFIKGSYQEVLDLIFEKLTEVL